METRETMAVDYKEGEEVLITVPHSYTARGVFKGFSDRGLARVLINNRVIKYVAPHFVQRLQLDDQRFRKPWGLSV